LPSGPASPDSLDALLKRAIELQSLGQHAKALEVFQECLDSDPANATAHFLSAKSNLEVGNWERGASHARVAAARDPGSAGAWCNLALGERGLGRKREAEFAARRAVGIDPRLADGWIALSLIARDAKAFDTARAHMERALEIDPDRASTLLSLADLDQAQGRNEAALEGYRRAQALDPTMAYAPYGRGYLLYKAKGDFQGAIASYREAIAARSDYAVAHHNLAHVLFLTGDFAEAWTEYRWRTPRLQFEARRSVAGRPYVPPREIPRAGSRLVVIAEQGLGDILFLLRFAPKLAERGIVLEFEGEQRLHGILSRTGLFEHIASPAEGARESGVGEILAGDIPLLFSADERADAPPAIALPPEASQVAAARARLAALGPGPYIGITWRAGVPRANTTESLIKELPLAAFGSALKGAKATWISMQREPRPGEADPLVASLGAPLHDFSAVNEDLEASLALMSVLNGYIGVSSTNVHLRAAANLGAHVLVPFPPEWRWMAQGTSRWFPAMRVHRQAVDGSWNEAFAQLAREIR
jgi:tetratricopeptide (TPR) repeat protein